MSAPEIAPVASATDVWIYVHESGTPGSPAVVFLHGAGASGRMWREHIARLTGFRCLAPDLPGFGRSNHLSCLSRTVMDSSPSPSRRGSRQGGRMWSASRGVARWPTPCWTATPDSLTGR